MKNGLPVIRKPVFRSVDEKDETASEKLKFRVTASGEGHA